MSAIGPPWMAGMPRMQEQFAATAAKKGAAPGGNRRDPNVTALPKRLSKRDTCELVDPNLFEIDAESCEPVVHACIGVAVERALVLEQCS